MKSTGNLAAFAKVCDQVMTKRKSIPIRFTNISIKEWEVMKGEKKVGTIRKIDDTEFRLFALGNPYPQCFGSLDDAQDDVLTHWRAHE